MAAAIRHSFSWPQEQVIVSSSSCHHHHHHHHHQAAAATTTTGQTITESPSRGRNKNPTIIVIKFTVTDHEQAKKEETQRHSCPFPFMTTTDDKEGSVIRPFKVGNWRNWRVETLLFRQSGLTGVIYGGEGDFKLEKPRFKVDNYWNLKLVFKLSCAHSSSVSTGSTSLTTTTFQRQSEGG